MYDLQCRHPLLTTFPEVCGEAMAAEMISTASMSQILWSTRNERPENTGVEDATRTLKCAGAIGRSLTTGIEEKRTGGLVGVMIEKKVAIHMALDLTDHTEVALKGNHVGGRSAFKKPHLHLSIVHGLMSGGIPGGGQRHPRVAEVDPEVVIAGPFRTVPQGHFHPGHQGHPTVIPAALLLEARTPVTTAVPDPGHLLLLHRLEDHVAISPHPGDHPCTALQAKRRVSREVVVLVVEPVVAQVVAQVVQGLLCWTAENSIILHLRLILLP